MVMIGYLLTACSHHSKACIVQKSMYVVHMCNWVGCRVSQGDSAPSFLLSVLKVIDLSPIISTGTNCTSITQNV